MTTAFSRLTGIRELGLSVLSCLGWLNGRDISDRAKLFQTKPGIFGSQYLLPDSGRRKNLAAWQQIIKSEALASERLQRRSDRDVSDAESESPTNTVLQLLGRRSRNESSTPTIPPLMFEGHNIENTDVSPTLPSSIEHGGIEHGVDPRSGDAWTRFEIPSGEGMMPSELSLGQEEWMMEIEWAQTAFLCSWTLSILDNPTIFNSLRTLNVANLSSTYLIALHRDDLWETLSGLEDLTVLVSPDWRHVYKHVQGHITTDLIRPSSAHGLFVNLLTKIGHINKSIRTLKVGYIGGGEHATGMFARNQNILPAPIMREPCPKLGPTIEDNIILLPRIEHLILINCWITPTALKAFFADNATCQYSPLKSATFDSVSLTAHDVKPASSNVDIPFDIPYSMRWLYAEPTPGSWSDVINTITPGPRISHARHTH
ncbi:MAG: hypothetical protein Q9222_007055, partial [Ikaeria aurantiellina]